MGLREQMSKNPRAGLMVGVVLLVTAVAVLIWTMRSEPEVSAPTKAFFTVDDGATWFADDITHGSSFTKDGKEAVRVYVYRCNDGSAFAGYLERYSEQGRALAAARGNSASGGPVAVPAGVAPGAQLGALEYKRKGDKAWVKPTDPRFTEVVGVTCPDRTIPTAVSP